MEKIKNWIINHKVWSVLGGICLIIIIGLLIMLISMFVGGASSKYGHRLDGIKEVTITDDTKDKITNYESDKISSTKVRIQGKIINIEINVKNSTSLDDAKAIAKDMLSIFSEDEIKFYDIQYFLIQEKAEGSEEEGYKITGTKHPNKEEIGWIKG